MCMNVNMYSILYIMLYMYIYVIKIYKLYILYYIIYKYILLADAKFFHIMPIPSYNGMKYEAARTKPVRKIY